MIGTNSQAPPFQQQQQQQRNEDISIQGSGPGSGFDALGILRSMIYDPPASIEQIGEKTKILNSKAATHLLCQKLEISAF